MTYTAIVHQEGQWFVAHCPDVGTTSQGESVETALANLSEATELLLEEFPAPEPARPILATFEVSVHA